MDSVKEWPQWSKLGGGKKKKGSMEQSGIMK